MKRNLWKTTDLFSHKSIQNSNSLNKFGEILIIDLKSTFFSSKIFSSPNILFFKNYKMLFIYLFLFIFRKGRLIVDFKLRAATAFSFSRDLFNSFEIHVTRGKRGGER